MHPCRERVESRERKRGYRGTKKGNLHVSANVCPFIEKKKSKATLVSVAPFFLWLSSSSSFTMGKKIKTRPTVCVCDSMPSYYNHFTMTTAVTVLFFYLKIKKNKTKKIPRAIFESESCSSKSRNGLNAKGPQQQRNMGDTHMREEGRSCTKSIDYEIGQPK